MNHPNGAWIGAEGGGVLDLHYDRDKWGYMLGFSRVSPNDTKVALVASSGARGRLLPKAGEIG